MQESAPFLAPHKLARDNACANSHWPHSCNGVFSIFQTNITIRLHVDAARSRWAASAVPYCCILLLRHPVAPSNGETLNHAARHVMNTPNNTSDILSNVHVQPFIDPDQPVLKLSPATSYLYLPLSVFITTFIAAVLGYVGYLMVLEPTAAPCSSSSS